MSMYCEGDGSVKTKDGRTQSMFPEWPDDENAVVRRDKRITDIPDELGTLGVQFPCQVGEDAMAEQCASRRV